MAMKGLQIAGGAHGEDGHTDAQRGTVKAGLRELDLRTGCSLIPLRQPRSLDKEAAKSTGPARERPRDAEPPPGRPQCTQ